MREILFRGKIPSEDQHFDDGYWVEGFYTRFNGKEHRIYTGYAETDCGDYYPDWCNVRPETVGQYTGLTDKNGKKIFEGDIIGNTDYWGKRYVEGVVKYGNFNCSCCDGVYGWYIDGGDIRDLSFAEVIGNIHDNPELLKGATDERN